MFFRRPLLVSIFALASASLAFGQEAVPSGGIVTPAPLPDAPRLAPRPTTGATLPQDSRSPRPETPLMPDQTPSLVKPEAPAAEPATTPEQKRTKTSKTEAFEQDQAEKIRFRQVHTQALADRKLEELWDKANVARKDADKRALLKEYYKLLYARMAKIDPSLKKVIDLQATTAEHRLTQSHITPTDSSGDAGEQSTAGRVFAE
jgi:hypothetical protein